MELAVPALPTPVPERPRERLLVLTGSDRGASLALEREIAIIGRDVGCDLQLQDGSVSRRHAAVVRTSEGALGVQDLGSRNGVLLNDVPVGREPVLITLGDRLQLGAHTILLLTVDDPLQNRLLEAQKLEAIGRITAGIAHDFNNVVFAALTTCAQLGERLREIGVSDRGVAECHADLSAALERAQDLTTTIATLGRGRATSVPSAVEVTAICDEVARLCERTFGPRYRLRRQWSDGIEVIGRRGEIHQILLNLCLNARDAMPGGGEIRLCAHAAARPGAPGEPRSGAVVRVADEGGGMSEHVRARLFEPFFTTKGEGRGTGLGLATVHRLVQEMGGEIEVESEVGRGSTFLVWLPAAPP